MTCTTQSSNIFNVGAQARWQERDPTLGTESRSSDTGCSGGWWSRRFRMCKHFTCTSVNLQRGTSTPQPACPHLCEGRVRQAALKIRNIHHTVRWTVCRSKSRRHPSMLSTVTRGQCVTSWHQNLPRPQYTAQSQVQLLCYQESPPPRGQFCPLHLREGSARQAAIKVCNVHHTQYSGLSVLLQAYLAANLLCQIKGRQHTLGSFRLDFPTAAATVAAAAAATVTVAAAAAVAAVAI